MRREMVGGGSVAFIVLCSSALKTGEWRQRGNQLDPPCSFQTLLELKFQSAWEILLFAKVEVDRKHQLHLLFCTDCLFLLLLRLSQQSNVEL